MFVDDDKIGRFKVSLILAARCQQQTYGIAAYQDAVVTARAKRPAAGPELMANATKLLDRLKMNVES